MVVPNGYKQTEVGVIPEDWEVKELGDIGTFKNGINKSSKDFGFGYPFVNLMDVFGKSSIVQSGHFGLINSNEIERKLYDLNKGDVLFIRSSVKPSGVGLTCVIENNLPNTVFSGFIIRYRDNNYLDSRYKRHCFYEERFRNSLISRSTVSANTNINQEALKKLKITIPTKQPEQTAIAEALSDMDELISSVEQQIEKKKAIKQGMVQELLKPKEGWVTKKLGDLGRTYGGLTGKSKVDFKDGNCSYIPFMNIMSDPIINSENFDRVKIMPGEKQNKAQKGDLFFNGSSETPEEVGMCSVLTEDIENLYLNSFCFGFRFHDNTEVNRLFLAYFFRSSFGRNLIFSLAQGATRYNLSKTNLLKLELQLPDITEQEMIANIIKDNDGTIHMLKLKLDKLKLQKQAMMQSLLTGKIRLI